MAEKLAALKKQRSTNKCKLTNLVKYAREDHSDTDVTELNTRLKRVEKLMEEFTELEFRIFTESASEESDYTYEENYYVATSALNNWIRSKNLTQGVTSLNETTNATLSGEHSQVKLPKIHIPAFSGEYSEWQSFHDMYTTTIHESPNLNPVQKFQYLKGLLRGEAAVLLRHIAVTEGNYIGALNKLKERYDRKKFIINTFIRTFFEQPSIHNSTASNIKRLMDTSDEVVRGLQALGEIGETRDPWLIYILLQKLDEKSKALWAEYSAEMINPEFSEFLKFLGRRIDTLESLIPASRRTSTKSEVRTHVVAGDPEKPIQGNAAIRSTIDYQCAMCKEKGHSLYTCNEFQSLDVKGRTEFANGTNRCFNCLSTRHPIFKCPSKRLCQKCGMKHNTLLHSEQSSDDFQKQTQSTAPEKINGLHSQYEAASVILPTAIINAVDDSGMIIPCRALLDSGSQASFITESCAQRLRLKKKNARIAISGIGQTGSGISKGLVTIHVRPKHFPEFSINALVMAKITSQLPQKKLLLNLKSYKGIELAGSQFNQSKNIDILIGADHFFNLLQNGQIKTSQNEPILQNTVFGWVVSGQSSNRKDDQLISMLALSNQESEMINIDRSLRTFWELESLNNQEIILSPEETFCENHFTMNLERNNQGRYIVKLPFKESPDQLGESLASAIQRLRGMERRFIRDPSFEKLYQDFMLEYQHLNHMIEFSPPKDQQSQFYLPHHGVLKASSDTSKMRVVFDGSAKSSTGISLNDCLAVGPNVQSSLYAIILRFREHKYAFYADIEKMYRQVEISPSDAKYQQIVWRDDSSKPIRHFRLMTVTYGLPSASFLATRALKQIAEENKNSAPHVSHVIATDIYVDDLMTGAENEDELHHLREKISEMLEGYGFHLRKWKSNSNKLLRSIAHEHQDAENKIIKDHTQIPSESVKVLGVNWNPKTDSFTFTSQLPDSTSYTKRSVLSEASRLFDPLGWVSPVVITYKIFLQMLWADNLEWDDPIPHDRVVLWEKMRNSLKTINKISIPRFINSFKDSITDTHGFCGASQSAYAAVVFFRTIQADGKISVQLISSKTKVAPIKQQTLPRLELCPAVLLTKLIQVVKRETNTNISETFAWTDSQIVLDWLASHPRRWSTFVGNRTAEILSGLSRKNWRHVPSADNPADCASRGLSASELKSNLLWWNGPSWLHKASAAWPPQANHYGNLDERANKPITFAFTCTKSNEWYDDMISRYSSFHKLQRVLCYILRFIGNASKPLDFRVEGSHLRRDELFHVVRIVCQHEQQQFYEDDIKALQLEGEVRKSSSLKSLDPFLDDSGLLRVGGRLHNSIAPYSTKHPIIMHLKSRITALILQDIHLANKHAGPTLLLSIVRQEYWIPNGKTKAKEIIRKCVICSKFKAQCQEQLMGSLPSARVELIRPFLKTGVDYAGPISIHLTKGRGQKTYKAYICLFICLSTKAVHLELASDLSSDAFLGALKRFTARRGICRELHSDNGTNFIGSDHKLQKEFDKIIKNSNNISNYLSSNRITWNFIPPSSPHFGGLWEAAIKSTKFHLKRVIGKHILTLEEMNTLLAEIEAILNSRPFSTINDVEVDPLTPSHFLIGHPHTKIPEMDITHLKVSHLTRWQLVQQMGQHFWKRWYIEYRTSLQQRNKWRTRKASIQANDVVLIKDKNLPVNQWPLARVVEIHPGSDGLVRVVTLKSGNNEFKRPINKLCLLPISPEKSDKTQHQTS